jgi:hypothetical protein
MGMEMINKPVIGVAAAVVLIAGGTWYYLQSRHQAAPPAAATAARPAPPVESAEPAIQHPVPEGEGAAAKAPLPALADSDAAISDALGQLVGAAAMKDYWVPDSIVRHIVVTVDNLPRKKLAVDRRPLKPTPGQTVTAVQGDIITLSPENAARYAPLMRVIDKTDVKALTLVYEHLYPLFQQSYEDLGYPGKYFNDRLVEVIDHLLQTPELTAPVQLTQPRVFYEYADADLENRSAGQKLLMRMGAANERAIKAKLRELRAEILKKR